MKKLLVLGLVIFVAGELWAQPNCTQTLRLARSTYEQGRLHEMEGLLASCLNTGFTPAEKVEAYKYLALAYIYLEEPEKADDAMLKILQTDHYFKINPNVDPAEFVALYNTFRTTPIYRVGIKAGANASQPNVTSYDAASDGTGKYGHRYGFQVGVTFEIPINDRLLLNPELYYALKSFSYKQTGIAGSSSAAYSVTANENQNWISLPLSVQYYFLKNKIDRIKSDGTESKFIPYISGGIATEYLLGANKIPSKFRGANLSDIKEETIDVTGERKRLNLSIIAGAGFKYRMPGGFLVGEIRYFYGLTKLTEKETTYSNASLVYNYNIVDGIFKLNSLSLSVGYIYNIFNPIKKKVNK